VDAATVVSPIVAIVAGNPPAFEAIPDAIEDIDCLSGSISNHRT